MDSYRYKKPKEVRTIDPDQIDLLLNKFDAMLKEVEKNNKLLLEIRDLLKKGKLESTQ